MGTTPKTFNDKYEEYMQDFLCRLLRHDFVVTYISDYFNQNERTYYSFFMLMKVLGAHKNLKFQTNYWSDCYIYFYEKLGIHGILFIPLLLSKGSTDDKKKIIKKYLNEHINNTKERTTDNSNLVINLLEFKKVILTYVSCVSTRGLENVIKAIDNDPKESAFLKDPEIKNEVKLYRVLYSNQLVESFVDVLLRPYSRQNYYVNAGKFIDDNIDFLTDDKKIRLRLREFSLKQKEISDLLKKANPFDMISSMNCQRDKNKIDNNIEEESNILSNNNITNTNDNIKSSRNKLIPKLNEDNTNKKIKEKNRGFPLITESENLNEPLKTNESARKGMLEVPQKPNIIENILKTNGRIKIIISNEFNIQTKYTFKKESKNFYYYHCSKRPKFKCKSKYNKSENIFYIIEKCINEDIYNKLTYDKLSNLNIFSTLLIISIKLISKKNIINIRK